MPSSIKSMQQVPLTLVDKKGSSSFDEDKSYISRDSDEEDSISLQADEEESFSYFDDRESDNGMEYSIGERIDEDEEYDRVEKAYDNEEQPRLPSKKINKNQENHIALLNLLNSIINQENSSLKQKLDGLHRELKGFNPIKPYDDNMLFLFTHIKALIVELSPNKFFPGTVVREAIQALPMGLRNSVLSVVQQCYHYILKQELNVIITTEKILVDNTELKNSRQTANVTARLSSQREDTVTLEGCLLDAIHFVNGRFRVEHSDTCTFQVIKSLQDTISEKDFEEIQKSSSLIHLVEVLKLLNQRNILLEEKTMNDAQVIFVHTQLCLNLNYILTSMINKPAKEKEVFEQLLKNFSAAELSYRQEYNDKKHNEISKNLELGQIKKIKLPDSFSGGVISNCVVDAINTQSALSIEEMQIPLDLPTTKSLKNAAVECKKNPTPKNKDKAMKLYGKLKTLYPEEMKESLNLEGPFDAVMVKINKRMTALQSRKIFIIDDKEDTQTKFTHLLSLREILLSLSKNDLSHPEKVKNLKKFIEHSLNGMNNHVIKKMKYPTVKRMFSRNNHCVSNTEEIFKKALGVAEQLNEKLSQRQTIIY